MSSWWDSKFFSNVNSTLEEAGIDNNDVVANVSCDFRWNNLIEDWHFLKKIRLWVE